MQFIQCFSESLKLGLSSFGGPVAHLGYFHRTYVEQLQWLDEEEYAEMLALCQFIPGPASSQLGALIGYRRGGCLGGVASWLGFTLPSAVLMIALVMGLSSINDRVGSGWIDGLKLAAVAIVALAVYDMAKKLCGTRVHLLIALVSLTVLFVVGHAWAQPLVILIGALMGLMLLRSSTPSEPAEKTPLPVASFVGAAAFVVAVASLPLLQSQGIVDPASAGLLRAGSMVFGGGHVVLPLLEQSFVGQGQMNQEVFLAGYGMAQAVPGPMFTLGSYLGAVCQIGGNAIVGGLLGTLAIFSPGMILLVIGLPMWNWLKQMPKAKVAVQGANAAVVGLLAAALLHLGTSGVVQSVVDLLFVALVGSALWSKKIPTWAIVLSSALIGLIVL
ncbi:chromate efflux transporter [Rubritalea marina]|uniref:chromate efflux transporter n=1 Tax=Rubritalea marina TaxID=361055 RepID=UPI000374342C|nr:chromate efflux transporter [Rubritalea marina]